MKKLILTALTGLLAVQLSALAENTWHTDFAKAQAESKKDNKVMLMDFTGSDWCVWCIKLKKDVFDTKEFSDYAAKNLVLLEVDFPTARKKMSAEQKKTNEELKNKFKVDGYPTIVAIDGGGKELWRYVGYMEGGPKAWIAKLDGLKKK